MTSRGALKLAEDRIKEAISIRDDSQDGITALEEREILIYGAGTYGAIIYDLLVQSGVDASRVPFFLDRGARPNQRRRGVPILCADDERIESERRRRCVVVVSIYLLLDEHAAIAAELKALGYEDVRSCYEIALSFSRVNDAASRLLGLEYFDAHIGSILDGLSLWDDDESLETYTSHLLGYIGQRLDLFSLERGHAQYFFGGLDQNDYQRFVDCGAYDGDTLRALERECGSVESIVAFEPASEAFRSLSRCVRERASELAQRVTLVPCGLWSETACLAFGGGDRSASALRESGEEVVQCVALDDCLHGAAPTFIKMDIEGAEYEALLGARGIIRRDRPAVAVCVYHDLSHLWSIPQLLREIEPEYRLALRAYGGAGFETVAYGIYGG